MFLGISTQNDSPLHSSTCLKICPLVHRTGISTSFSILYWETGEPLSHNIFLRAFGYIVIPAERGEEKAGEERGSARLAADFCCEINREETLYQRAIRRHGLECRGIISVALNVSKFSRANFGKLWVQKIIVTRQYVFNANGYIFAEAVFLLR